MPLTEQDAQLLDALEKRRSRAPREDPAPGRPMHWPLLVLVGLLIAVALLAGTRRGGPVLENASPTSTTSWSASRPPAGSLPNSHGRLPPELRTGDRGPAARDPRAPSPRSSNRTPPAARDADDDDGDGDDDDDDSDDDAGPETLEDRLDDLEEEIGSMEEEVEDLSEPVGEFETFDQCMHFVGVTEYGSESGASGYRFDAQSSTRHPAFEMDLRGFGFPQYQFLAYPGEEPPSIECNEDADARPEND